jgi:hypothetical protein
MSSPSVRWWQQLQLPEAVVVRKVHLIGLPTQAIKPYNFSSTLIAKSTEVVFRWDVVYTKMWFLSNVSSLFMSLNRLGRKQIKCRSTTHDLCPICVVSEPLNIFILSSMAVQPFVGPWPICHFHNPIQSRYDSLDGGWACRKAATYTQDSTNTEKTQTSMTGVRFEPTIPAFKRVKTFVCLRPCGHCDRL